MVNIIEIDHETYNKKVQELIDRSKECKKITKGNEMHSDYCEGLNQGIVIAATAYHEARMMVLNGKGVESFDSTPS